MAIFPYQTEMLTDFTKPENRERYQQALAEVEATLNQTLPLVIGNNRVFTKNTYTSLNPSDHTQVIATISQAGIKEADEAMEVALATFESWKKVPPCVRADVLFKAAAILKRERFLFNALMTLEAGKPWIEADADTAEAIDFLEYYGREMLSISKVDDEILSRKDIERNEYRYIPLGVGAIIAPWNFPLAILTGMTSAAIVCGNTVIMKPAMTTQTIAYRFVDLLLRAGLPEGVVSFLPGRGSEIGDYLVKHPKTRFISFTGSKEVGINIYENAAKVNKGQIWLKRVIAEMGGKDAILVDDGYDPDQAAQAIVTSAFGFSGQKCSACSRAVIHENIYDEVVKKIIEKTKKIKVGDPRFDHINMGPVNDGKAFDSIMKYIEIGKNEGKLVFGGTGEKDKGWFINPTIIIDVDPLARIMQEEIFGPVVAITKVKSFAEGLEVVNNTEFGLTGACLSNNRLHLEMAREDFHVGNLYLNRKCTGAIVGYQPFGGFNLSGTDSKAGGPDYLLLHLQGKSISEAL
ncbi:MAG: L-glutamate gamma-semialdehyde dehydrogenase [Candidatus Izemoplasmatales bacterium]|nr:L-glutamate gamma-semialdehyde dehydrogenase [Candidatus Izemoplasmatales bacterium]